MVPTDFPCQNSLIFPSFFLIILSIFLDFISILLYVNDTFNMKLWRNKKDYIQ